MRFTGRLTLETSGHSHVLDITAAVMEQVQRSKIRDGLVCVFVPGSTAAITTTEAEPGLLNHDLRAFFDRVVPDDIPYRHEDTWSDDNGHSHVRASLVGPSVALPLIDGAIPLGKWQHVVLIDFDTRGRRRELIVQVVGE
ncbi:MAG: YjbQ family protein [Planctomycetia bacterium]|nr:MAG: YjbQ family protein [Planctomycetia bacterium]